MRLSDIISNSLEDRRGYLTIAIVSKREGKLLLRRTEGIKAEDLQKCQYRLLSLMFRDFRHFVGNIS